MIEAILWSVIWTILVIILEYFQVPVVYMYDLECS